MDQEYDLAQLAEDLGNEIPEIIELYLFGSRARVTKSSRSDVDILVVSSQHIQPQALRRFSLENCVALDLFLVEGGKATSSQNESFIEASDFQKLLKKLGAVKIWSRESGREAAKIQWRFTVKEGVSFSPSVLPSAAVLTNEEDIEPAKLTLGQLFSRLTMPQLSKLIVVFFGIVVLAFQAGRWYEELLFSIKSADQQKQVVAPDAPRERVAE